MASFWEVCPLLSKEISFHLVYINLAQALSVTAPFSADSKGTEEGAQAKACRGANRLHTWMNFNTGHLLLYSYSGHPFSLSPPIKAHVTSLFCWRDIPNSTFESFSPCTSFFSTSFCFDSPLLSSVSSFLQSGLLLFVSSFVALFPLYSCSFPVLLTKLTFFFLFSLSPTNSFSNLSLKHRRKSKLENLVNLI